MDVVEPSNVSHINLIVRDGNRDIEDKIVKCTTSWTILQLKQHIFNVYFKTCNSTVLQANDIKIIYAGKLLKDNSKLKDELKYYAGKQTTHTVHMVCNHIDKKPKSNAKTPTPSSTPASSSSSANHQTSGQSTNASTSSSVPANENEIRHRNLHANHGHEHTGTHHRSPYYQMDPYAQHHHLSHHHHHPQHPQDHHHHPQPHVSRPYHYYPHYTHGHHTPHSSQPTITSVSQYQIAHQRYERQMDEYMKLYNEKYRDYMNGVASGAQSETPAPAPPTPTAETPAAAPAPAPVPAPAPAARANNGDDEDEEEQDWLQMVYSGIRFLLFASFIYYYSTVFRFIAVSGIFGIVYLYQRNFYGVFRRLGIQGNPGAAAGAAAGAAMPPGAGAEAAANQNAQAPAADVNAQPPADADTPPTNETTNPAEPAAQAVPEPRIGTLTMIFNICLTFFTSMVPQQPEVGI